MQWGKHHAKFVETRWLDQAFIAAEVDKSAVQLLVEEVEGIGAARAAMLRRHFDRWRTTAATWEPDPA